MMPSTSEMQELRQIEEEMNQVALKQQQLKDRHAMLIVLEKFKKDASQAPSAKVLMRIDSEDCGKSSELQQIEEKLAALEKEEAELQRRKDKILYPKSQQSDSLLDNSAVIPHGGVFVLPPVPDLVVAPLHPCLVILDPKNLPAHPSQTQCPSCHQFITTEIITKVGTVTWLACVMSAMLGCVAGCCFIPFCISNFKDIIHQCPRCRTKIHTIPKL